MLLVLLLARLAGTESAHKLYVGELAWLHNIVTVPTVATKTATINQGTYLRRLQPAELDLLAAGADCLGRALVWVTFFFEAVVWGMSVHLLLNL